MEVFRAIKTRRSVRSWEDREVPIAIVKRILDAGRWAPSPVNSQPWHFVVVQERETIRALARTARRGRFLERAPLMVVVVVHSIARIDAWDNRLLQNKYAGAAAMENMMLAAWALGLGSCWVTVEERDAERLLNIPKNRTVLGAIALGFPKGSLRKHGEWDRKRLTAIVSFEQFQR